MNYKREKSIFTWRSLDDITLIDYEVMGQISPFDWVTMRNWQHHSDFPAKKAELESKYRETSYKFKLRTILQNSIKNNLQKHQDPKSQTNKQTERTPAN